MNRARSWGGVWLAELVDSRYAHVRAALARGRISEEHAAVIVWAAESVAESVPESVPGGVDPAALARCEEALVEKATRMSPRALRVAARRILEPLSKSLADAHEGQLLGAEEARAERETWMSLGDNGDGTWSGRFVIPALHGQLLKTVLETLSGPRRFGRNAAGQPTEDPTLPGMGSRLSYTEALGSALTELIEHLPTSGSGSEGGLGRSAVTLVVHIDEAALRSGVGAGTLDSGTKISAGQARRLACTAGHLPLVLGGRSQPLDVGTSRRLFTHAQSVALSALYDSCAAEDCDRPFAWCELHHKTPYGQGGPTDLDNGAPLCGYHHRRVHDDRYEHHWLPDGSVRFRHRWPSRRRDAQRSWAAVA